MSRGLKFKKLGLIVNSGKANVPAAAKRVAELVQAQGVQLLLERGNAGLKQVVGGQRMSSQKIGETADLLISLGGDGTLLRSAAIARLGKAPILGVNLGTLGFVTALKMEEMDLAIPQVLQGIFRVEPRSMVEGRILSGTRVRKRLVALNELLVAKGFPGRVAELLCEVNNQTLAVYRADGLIIATPTGSTAYALSVGGPILEPSLKTLLLAPISPHALSNRPLVVGDRSVIRISTTQYRDPIYAAADGQERFALKRGEVLEVRLAKETTRLLMPPSASFYNLLREKMGWRGK